MNFEDFFDNDVMKFVRKTVLSAYPSAVERISYGIPAWFATKEDGGKVLLYAKTWAAHLGIYPESEFISTNRNNLNFKTTKGTIKVPFDTDSQRLETLLKTIITYNLEKSRRKS